LPYRAGRVSDGGPGVAERRGSLVMDFALVAVAEKLVAEFPHQSGATVLRVVTGCAGEFPDDDRLFVEQAARAQLSSGESVT
jgi:hypothetical protein